MYSEHFGLEKELFEDSLARDSDVYLGARQKLIAANLTIALTRRDSVALLSGPPGVGKTTIASQSLRNMATRLALGWLGSLPASPHELLEQLLTEFGFTPYRNSRTERLQIWRQFLSEMSITDTRVCVLVENAQDFDPEVLRTLENLTARDPSGCPGANVVLTSSTRLRDLLELPGLAALRQRTRMRGVLEPFTAAETHAYLEHKVAAAGGADLFGEGAVDMLHAYSQGIARVINNLCESALTVAATRHESRLSAKVVKRVAEGLFDLALESTATRQTATAEPAEGGAAAAEPAEAGAAAPRAAGPETPAPEQATSETATAEAAAQAPEEARPAEQETAEPRTTATETDVGSADTDSDVADADMADTQVAANDDVPTLEPAEVVEPAPAETRLAAADDRALLANAEEVVMTEAEIDAALGVGDKSITLDADFGHTDAQTRDEDDALFLDDDAILLDDDAILLDDDAILLDDDGVLLDDDGLLLDDELPALGGDDHVDGMTDASDDTEALDPDEVVVDEDEVLPFANEALDVPTLTDSVELPDDVAEALADASEQALDEQEAAFADLDLDAFDDADEDSERARRSTLEAFANAKALEEISNSMAETLFGDVELGQLAATLAVSAETEARRSHTDDEDAPAPRANRL